VNVSPRQLGQEDFSSMVAGTLESCGFPPGRLELEITESAVMGSGEVPLAALRRLKALGVKVAMDDFGTGYSSLSHLSQLPLDRLKVDRSFVRRMGEDARDAAIVQSIVALGHGLGLNVVAEGVETPQQLQSLAAMGCDEAQGFLLAQPISDERVRELLGPTERA
jgi:EAL domain-containing protein (putative c-di-GMP-specific phosphodiesterase class I)